MRGLIAYLLGPTVDGQPAGTRRRARSNVDSRSLFELEERRLLTTYFSPDPLQLQPAFSDLVLADVVGRHVFYNNSKFDGNNPAASAADDAAIAPDKTAMFPTQSATFANYTSFSGGLNGIMVDIAGLPGTPTAADFEFRQGNTTTPGSWQLAPAPTSVTVRRGAGDSGADRVTLVWSDATAVRGNWLQVTVKATPATGLSRPDVFYFGNSIGETGTSLGDSRVNSTDEYLTRSNQHTFLNPAAVDSAYDFNRDGLVNSTDIVLTRSHATTLQTALARPTLPAVTFAEFERATPELFKPGDLGYSVFYSPVIIVGTDGTVLAFAEARTGIPDNFVRSIVMRRSFDSGVTWNAVREIFIEPNFPTEWTGCITPVVDKMTGSINLVFTRSARDPFVMRSFDQGATWTTPVDITADVKVNGDNPPGHNYRYKDWTWYATGPGHGIQIQNGPYAGRLIIAADHRSASLDPAYSWTHTVYSDDHGATWHLGGGVYEGAIVNLHTNEASIVELSNGDLYMSIRVQRENNLRGYSISKDGGMTWTDVQKAPELTTPPIAATVLRLNDNVILYAAPDNPVDTRRRQMTIWASYDDAKTWVKSKVLFYDYAGYSDMTVVGPDTVLLTYNRSFVDSALTSYASVGLTRFNLRWLETPEPAEFSWYFNEGAAGQSASVTAPTILDYGKWDLRASAQGSPAPNYVAGQQNDTALALTEGSDHVKLTHTYSQALHLGPADSLTVQLNFRTTDTDGVFIGTVANGIGWDLKLVAGRVQFTLRDGTNTAVISSTATVNNGAWRQLAVVRDAQTHQLRLYVDRVANATAVTDPTGDLFSNNYDVLGSYSDGTQQLTADIDTLRITRGVVAAANFIPANFVSPRPLATAVFGPLAPPIVDQAIATAEVYTPWISTRDESGERLQAPAARLE